MSGEKRECHCPRARHSHGMEQAYITDACRCPDCREAHRQAMSHRRRMRAYGRDTSGLVPTAGSVRRLDALAVNGWSCAALGGLLGWDPTTLHRFREQDRITRAKAEKFAALYDELWDLPAPTGTKGERISSARMRGWARRHGCLPALAWDDDEIDDPTAGPHFPQEEGAWDLTPCGTHAAARRHYRRGEPLCDACRNADRRHATEMRARKAA